MDMDNLRNGRSNDNEQSSGPEQHKSLIANVYSSRGAEDPDPYKQLTDWEVSDEDIQLAYDVTSGGGLVRRNIKRLTASGSHEEWYTQLQVALAHRVAQLTDTQLPDGREVRGAVPVMEQVSITGDDIMDYLRAHPDEIDNLDSEELAEIAQSDAEPAAAEADD